MSFAKYERLLSFIYFQNKALNIMNCHIVNEITSTFCSRQDFFSIEESQKKFIEERKSIKMKTPVFIYVINV